MQQGFHVGSHSLNHVFFKDIDLDEKKRQINESFAYLANNLGIKDRYFSYPFSDEGVDTVFFDWLHHTANCQWSFGISGIKHDVSPRHLHRIPFEKGDFDAQSILQNQYLYYVAKFFLNKNKIKR